MSPARQEVVLGLDAGTQSTKALLLDPISGECVAKACEAHAILPALEPGDARQHPDTWWRAVCAAVAEVRRLAPEAAVVAIGVSGQQHGLVTLDDAGEATGDARLWCDTTTAREAQALSREIGNEIPVGFTASKIMRVQSGDAARWARTRHLLLPAGFIGFRLSGRATIDAGDASGTGLFDAARRHWNERAIAALGGADCRSRLPELVEPGQAIGALTAQAAQQLGLEAGIPIAPGSGDNMMSALGVGCTASGCMALSLGTSGTVFGFADAPVSDPKGLIAGFCDATGGWLPLLCVMNLTGVFESFRRLAGSPDLQTLTRAAEAVPAGCDGLMLLPYLNGERVPALPEATGSLHGLTHLNSTPGHHFRAALEGTAWNLDCGWRHLQTLIPAPAELRLVGGAAQNGLYRRILASILQVPVRVAEESDSAALGAALAAAWVLTPGAAQDLKALSDRAVRLSPLAVEPEDELVAAYASDRVRFGELLSKHHGVAPLSAAPSN